MNDPAFSSGEVIDPAGAPLVLPTPSGLPLITAAAVLARLKECGAFGPSNGALLDLIDEVDVAVHMRLRQAELAEFDGRMMATASEPTARLLIHQAYEARDAHQQVLLRAAALDTAQGLLVLRYPSLLPGVDGEKLLRLAMRVSEEVGASITVSFPQSTTEELASVLHEAGRAAVAAGQVVNKVDGQRFLEWHELHEAAREGRRSLARVLLEKFTISPRA